MILLRQRRKWIGYGLDVFCCTYSTTKNRTQLAVQNVQLGHALFEYPESSYEILFLHLDFTGLSNYTFALIAFCLFKKSLPSLWQQLVSFITQMFVLCNFLQLEKSQNSQLAIIVGRRETKGKTPLWCCCMQIRPILYDTSFKKELTPQAFLWAGFCTHQTQPQEQGLPPTEIPFAFSCGKQNWKPTPAPPVAKQ